MNTYSWSMLKSYHVMFIQIITSLKATKQKLHNISYNRNICCYWNELIEVLKQVWNIAHCAWPTSLIFRLAHKYHMVICICKYYLFSRKGDVQFLGFVILRRFVLRRNISGFLEHPQFILILNFGLFIRFLSIISLFKIL